MVGPKLSVLWEARNNRRKSPFVQYWPVVVLLTKALRGSAPGFVVRICGLVASVIAEGIRRPEEEFTVCFWEQYELYLPFPVPQT